MKKILSMFIIITLCCLDVSAGLISNGNQLQYEPVKPKDKNVLSMNNFGCTLDIDGEIQSNAQLIHFPIGDKSFISYWSMNFIDGSEVKVTLDGEVFNFDSGGQMQIAGFFGKYTSIDNVSDDNILNIHLNGKAFYVRIKGDYHKQIDESYLPIVHSLNNITHSLDRSPLELQDEDLDCLSYLSDCTITGLGEATHGTKEFFQMKHRIFKYLVEKHNYTCLAFECEMSGSYYIDRFVTSGEGDIDSILLNSIRFPWTTMEVKNFLLWMKEYNEDKSDLDKIHFIGNDCQFFIDHSDIIAHYFEKGSIILTEGNLNFLNKIKEIGINTYSYYETVSLEEFGEINQNVDSLLAMMNESGDQLIGSSSEFEYHFIKRIIGNIKQVNHLWYSYAHDGDMLVSANIRDFYMAENTLWIHDVVPKIAVWAHNGHIAKVSSNQITSMGSILKEELGDGYQIINFAFSRGSFTAYSLPSRDIETCSINQEPMIGSINYVFHYAQNNNFIVRKSDIIDGSFFDIWISEPHRFLEIGAGYNPVLLNFYYQYVEFKKQYDVLIYWDVTTSSDLITPI